MFMKNRVDVTTSNIIAKAKSFQDVFAGIAPLEEVLKGFSYRVVTDGHQASVCPRDSVETWIEGGRSILVIGLHHPENHPGLDWFDGGNTIGNRRLMDISGEMIDWIKKAHGRRAQLLPYWVEQGGVFLKDAAVISGLGVIGKNNLLITPEWGPRLRFRGLLIEGDLPPSGPMLDFAPCEGCDRFCHRACPQSAFPDETYSRAACWTQLELDRRGQVSGGEPESQDDSVAVIKWCRECEFACPVGAART